MTSCVIYLSVGNSLLVFHFDVKLYFFCILTFISLFSPVFPSSSSLTGHRGHREDHGDSPEARGSLQAQNDQSGRVSLTHQSELKTRWGDTINADF